MFFSLIVPLVPQHDKYFFDFLLEAKQFSERVGEVVVSRSNANLFKQIYFKKKLTSFLDRKDIGFTVKLIQTSEKLLAGENRNRAWLVASNPYVVFCDADDSYSPYRLLMLEEAINRFKPDLILHDYFSGVRLANYSYSKPDKLEYVSTKDIFQATFLDSRNRRLEGITPGDTNIRVPLKLNNHVKIHHAHACARLELREKILFGDTFRAEDGQFCRDVLEQSYEVIYIPWELSTWVYSRSTAAKPKLQAIRKIFNRFKKSLMPIDFRFPI